MELSKNAKLMISYLFDRISSLQVDQIELSFKNIENANDPIKLKNTLVFNKKDFNIEEIILDPAKIENIDSELINNINEFVDKEKDTFLQLNGIINNNNDFVLTLALLSSKGKIMCPKIEAKKLTGPHMIPVDFDLATK